MIGLLDSTLPTRRPWKAIVQRRQVKASIRIDIDRWLELPYPPAVMSSPFYRAVALYFLLGISIDLGAAETARESHDGVLVLRNGFVLQGRITPINDVFLITMGASGEVRLPRAQVEFQCRDLDHAYLQQRDALLSDDPSAHLQLAEWCLRHGLLSRAADQMLVVVAQDPSNPQLRGLEKRLLALTAKPETPAIASKSQTQSTQPAAFTKSKLSPQMMQQFSTVVQPILFNRCATHACHGNGSSNRFHLIRPTLGHAPTSRMTQRNLQITLSFMDHENPENSPVLIQGKMAHGGAPAPAFADKHANQLDLLEAWVRRAAIIPTSSIATNSGGPQRARNQTPSSKPAVQANGIGVDDSKSVVPAGHREPQPPMQEGHMTRSTEDPSGRDPFDPEIFNRRYHQRPEMPPDSDSP